MCYLRKAFVVCTSFLFKLSSMYIDDLKEILNKNGEQNVKL